ncbi:MAG: polymer-forming cytoskeletal protein [Defluviitaleaceae bacterium]|nr:polymer-forming cytoskeletal protein [Defluviitaleaceae bacterium]
MISKYLKKSTEPGGDVSTFVGEGIELSSGNIKGCGSVRVDGIMSGNVDIDGDLFIGDAGHLKGNASANYAYITGRLDGSVFVTGLLHLTSSANVQGDIGCTTILIEEGAVFGGNCRMAGKVVERSAPLVLERKERAV